MTRLIIILLAALLIINPINAELKTISFYARGLTYATYFNNKQLVDNGLAQDIPSDLGLGVGTDNNKVASVSAKESGVVGGNTLLFSVVFDADANGVTAINNRKSDQVYVFYFTNKALDEQTLGFLTDVSSQFITTPAPVSPCDERLSVGAECTTGSKTDKFGYCECTEIGYACDVRRGLCRKVISM